MKKRSIFLLILFLLFGARSFASEPLFDLSEVSYFDGAHFIFLQQIKQDRPQHGSRGGRFMPDKGEVQVEFYSRRNGVSYEMVTKSRQSERLLYTTEAVISRFGITERYVMYDESGRPSYSYRYDATEGKGYVVYLDEKGTRVEKRVTVNPDAYSMMTIPYIIGAFRVDDANRHSMHALVGDGRTFGLYIQKIDREEVLVRERSYACSKIECGFSGIIGLFAPKLLFWVDEKSRIPVKQDMMGGSIIEVERIYD
jgi:hypothetical protein